MNERPKNYYLFLLSGVLLALFVAWRQNIKGGWIALGYAAMGAFIGCISYELFFPKNSNLYE